MSDHLEIKEISVHAGMSDETDPLRVASVPDTQRNEGGIPRVQKSTEGRRSNDQPKQDKQQHQCNQIKPKTYCILNVSLSSFHGDVDVVVSFLLLLLLSYIFKFNTSNSIP